jgi:hypothetical protein
VGNPVFSVCFLTLCFLSENTGENTGRILKNDTPYFD